MAVSQVFKDIVDEGKRRKVILATKNGMIADPTMKGLNDELKYAESKMPNLYDKHDGEIFDYNKSSWTKEYLDKQLGNVMDNFSKERLEFLRQMVTYIYADRIKQFNREREQERRKSSTNINKKQVGTVAAGAGVVTCVVGAVMEAPAVAAIGAGVALVGGALIVMDIIENNK